MSGKARFRLLPLLLLAVALPAAAAPKVGVLFVVHGGSDEQDVANTFDSTLQFFQYDPNTSSSRTSSGTQGCGPR